MKGLVVCFLGEILRNEIIAPPMVLGWYPCIRMDQYLYTHKQVTAKACPYWTWKSIVNQQSPSTFLASAHPAKQICNPIIHPKRAFTICIHHLYSACFDPEDCYPSHSARKEQNAQSMPNANPWNLVPVGSKLLQIKWPCDSLVSSRRWMQISTAVELQVKARAATRPWHTSTPRRKKSKSWTGLIKSQPTFTR